MRESVLKVIGDPSGCNSGTARKYGVTATLVVLKTGVLDRTLVILTTLMDLLSPPSWISHMGSPALESCMTVGRRLKPVKSFWKALLPFLSGVPLSKALISMLLTCT